MTDQTRRLIFLCGVLILYVGIFIWLDFLGFAPERDEVHFWPTSLDFSHALVPSLEQLRSYGELNTPLPFLIFGWTEHSFSLGISGGRLVNLLLSFVIVIIVGMPHGKVSVESVLCVAGVLSFPYFLGASVLLYTDIIAAFFALTGVVYYLRQQYIAASILFILGIASRQYIFAFPLAVLGYELFSQWRSGRVSLAAIASPTIALASIFVWFVFFGGFAPAAEMAARKLSTSELLRLFPDHCLYSLTAIGAYYVIPEAILFRRIPSFPSLKQAAITAILLGIAFILFPPLNNVDFRVAETMGFLDIAMRTIFPDLIRMLVFYLLALLTCLRFRQLTLPSFLVYANALVMLKTNIGWDKYVLPVLPVLWYLNSLSSEQQRHGSRGQDTHTTVK